MDLSTVIFTLISLVAVSAQIRISSKMNFPRRLMPFHNQQTFGGQGRSFNTGAHPRGPGLRTRMRVSHGRRPGHNINIIRQTIVVHPDALRPSQPKPAGGPGVSHSNTQQSAFPSVGAHAQQPGPQRIPHGSGLNVGQGAAQPAHRFQNSPSLAQRLAQRMPSFFSRINLGPNSAFLRRDRVRHISLPMIRLSHNISFVAHPSTGARQNSGAPASGSASSSGSGSSSGSAPRSGSAPSPGFASRSGSAPSSSSGSASSPGFASRSGSAPSSSSGSASSPGSVSSSGSASRSGSGQQVVVPPNGKHTKPIIISAQTPATATQVINVTNDVGTTLKPGEDPPELPETNTTGEV